jgi:hypothetical protein
MFGVNVMFAAPAAWPAALVRPDVVAQATVISWFSFG